VETDVIQYRAFLNSDPPAIVKMWNQLAPARWLMRPISVSILERRVLSKPYFDRHGLILALEGPQVVGIAHAGFGPNDTRTEISTDVGIICVLLVREHPDQLEIRRKLVLRAEEYLATRMPREIRVGGIHGESPFYLGMYGGSALTGILKSDAAGMQVYQEMGYAPREEMRLMGISISDFRQLTDRHLIQNRRKFNVESDFDVKSANWWEACQFAQIDRFRFRLRPRPTGPVAGEVTFWDMGPLNPGAAVAAMGLTNLVIEESQRRHGLGTFLVGEAMRQVQAAGIGIVLVQVSRQNEPANRLFEKLGFRESDTSVSYSKMWG
jgi:ribosomal protein S18 acetylase RimI-like enzyme